MEQKGSFALKELRKDGSASLLRAAKERRNKSQQHGKLYEPVLRMVKHNSVTSPRKWYPTGLQSLGENIRGWRYVRFGSISSIFKCWVNTVDPNTVLSTQEKQRSVFSGQ